MSPFISILTKLLLVAIPQTVNSLTVENCDFGETYAFNKAECQITFGNESDKPVRVFDILPDNLDDSSELNQVTIVPHSHAYLTVHVNTGNASGYSRHTFRFHTDESGSAEGRVDAFGFVLSALDESSPEIDFGVVDLDEALPEKSLNLNSHNITNFHILRLLEKPAWTDVVIAPDGHTVEARIRSDALLGLHSQFIKLAIDTPQQKQVWISVSADVHGDIVPISNPFSMGLIRVANNNEFVIPLNSRSRKPFTVGKLELENVEGEVEAVPCQPESGSCRWLKLTISHKQPQGTIKGNLWVDLPEKKQRLQIALRGLLVDNDFKVKTFDPGKLQATKTDKQNDLQTTIAHPAVDLNKAIKNVVQQASDTPPPGNGPLLKWTVANGRLIYGFQIFRAEGEAGPFVLQNDHTIRADVDDDEPRSYQWRDSAAVSGKIYWYYIGIVNKNGQKQQLSSPQKVKAK